MSTDADASSPSSSKSLYSAESGDGTQPLECHPPYDSFDTSDSSEVTQLPPAPQLVRQDARSTDTASEPEPEPEASSGSPSVLVRHDAAASSALQKAVKSRKRKATDPNVELKKWSVGVQREGVWYPEMQGKTSMRVTKNKTGGRPDRIELLTNNCRSQTPYGLASDARRKVRTPFMKCDRVFTYPYGTADKAPLSKDDKKEDEKKDDDGAKTLRLEFMLSSAAYCDHLCNEMGADPHAVEFMDWLDSVYADEFLYRFVLSDNNSTNTFSANVRRVLLMMHKGADNKPLALEDIPRAAVVAEARSSFLKAGSPVGQYKDVSERYIPVGTYLTRPFTQKELKYPKVVPEEWKKERQEEGKPPAKDKPENFIKSMTATKDGVTTFIAEMSNTPHYRFRTRKEKAANPTGHALVPLEQEEVAKMFAAGQVAASCVLSGCAKQKDKVRIDMVLHSAILLNPLDIQEGLIDPDDFALYKEGEYVEVAEDSC
jgi:hypothetical protein